METPIYKWMTRGSPMTQETSLRCFFFPNFFQQSKGDQKRDSIAVGIPKCWLISWKIPSFDSWMMTGPSHDETQIYSKSDFLVIVKSMVFIDDNQGQPHGHGNLQVSHACTPIFRLRSTIHWGAWFPHRTSLPIKKTQVVAGSPPLLVDQKWRFPKSQGYPPVIIHFERWDFS